MSAHEEHEASPKSRIIRIAVTAILLIIAYLLPLSGVWKAAAFVVPYLLIGGETLLDALQNIRKGELFDEAFLMSAATLCAFAIGEYPEAVGVMIFFQIGEMFEDFAAENSRRSISALMDIRSDRATVLRADAEEIVPPETVSVGEIIRVGAGEKIPLDGIIISGETSIYVGALTGESLPVAKTVGDEVVSGAVNQGGVICVRVTRPFADSTVSKILELVEHAAEHRSYAENFITRFSKRYTPCVVICAILLAFLPTFFFGQPVLIWLRRACIFLMVSCPCALVVSVPMSFFGGIGGASRIGILMKGADHLEMLAQINTMVFDKTGTLTHGDFDVDAIHPTHCTPAELLDIAAVAEQFSTHPVARSILRAHGGHLDAHHIGTVEEMAGLGIHAVIDDDDYYIGNRALMEKINADAKECHRVGTVLHIARGSESLGHIVIRDAIKPNAPAVILALRDLGIRETVMLSGDRQDVAEDIGKQAGIDKIHAGLLPAEKVSAMDELLGQGRKIAFVGDGINDAPVLMRADLGVAMGAMGSDAAMEAADIVLMDDDLQKLPTAIRIARKTMKIVRQNIVLALSVKLVILVLSAFGIADMWLAVFGDVGVLILTVLNALRCLRVDE